VLTTLLLLCNQHPENFHLEKLKLYPWTQITQFLFCFYEYFFFFGTGVWTQGLHLEPFISTPFIVLRFFQGKFLRNYLPGLTLSLYPPDLCPVSSWNYRCESLTPGTVSVNFTTVGTSFSWSHMVRVFLCLLFLLSVVSSHSPLQLVSECPPVLRWNNIYLLFDPSTHCSTLELLFLWWLLARILL
jgi:hypothetical protein